MKDASGGQLLERSFPPDLRSRIFNMPAPRGVISEHADAPDKKGVFINTVTHWRGSQFRTASDAEIPLTLASPARGEDLSAPPLTAMLVT